MPDLQATHRAYQAAVSAMETALAEQYPKGQQVSRSLSGKRETGKVVGYRGDKVLVMVRGVACRWGWEELEGV